MNRIAPEVAQDFLHKTNITDHIDFNLADDYEQDYEFDMVDQERDPNEMDFEQDPIDDFIAYLGPEGDDHLSHQHQQIQEEHQMEGGNESPDLLLHFGMLEDSPEDMKDRSMAYVHHDMMSTIHSTVDSVHHLGNVPEGLNQQMMDGGHQLYLNHPR